MYVGQNVGDREKNELSPKKGEPVESEFQPHLRITRIYRLHHEINSRNFLI